MRPSDNTGVDQDFELLWPSVLSSQGLNLVALDTSFWLGIRGLLVVGALNADLRSFTKNISG